MSRGGRREGAGRKPGSVSKLDAEARRKAAEGGITPLDFLLSLVRDDDQDARWRLDAAKAAAPYCHARLSATEVSGPSGGPVSVETTNRLDISGMTDEELDALECALRKTFASQERAEETT
jgi:hypothetical protein